MLQHNSRKMDIPPSFNIEVNRINVEKGQHISSSASVLVSRKLPSHNSEPPSSSQRLTGSLQHNVLTNNFVSNVRST